MTAPDHAAIVRDGLRCPEHGIRDCSPLLNGCSRVNVMAAALDALVRERDEARAENERLRQALRKHGRHSVDPMCPSIIVQPEGQFVGGEA